MAIVDTKAKGSRASQTVSDAAEQATSSTESVSKVVNIIEELKTLPAGKVSKQDLSEDAWQFAAPPPDGRYPLKLQLGKDAVVIKPNQWDAKVLDMDDCFYVVNIEGTLATDNPEHKGIVVFAGVTTKIGRGKNISTAAGLLVKLGHGENKALNGEISERDLALLTYKALQREPIIDVEINWQGWSKELGKVVCRKMTDFPPKRDSPGEYQHIYDYNLGREHNNRTEEIRASLKVNHWYGKGEASIQGKGASASTGTSQGKGSNGNVPILDEEPQMTMISPSGTTAAPVNSQANVKSDMDLLELD